jgi:IS5 family transposase
MLRTRNEQPSLWESVLPEICLRLPVELERVDAWLDDDRFFAPFVAHFSARMGRPSIPMETYLRLMFLKHRYRLGYETLCAEVSDSISWRRFCRIDIDARSIAAHLRLRNAQAREQAQATIARITGELAGLAQQSRTEAQAVLRNARRALTRTTGPAKGRLRRAVNELTS